MAGRRRKRGGHGGGEHENSERWLLTYADMITLLTAFFIMLYAMSVMNQTKFQQLAISVRSGFGGNLTNQGKTLTPGGGTTPGRPSLIVNNSPPKETPIFPVPPKSKEEKRDIQALDSAYSVMRAYIIKHKLQDVMQVVRNERGVVVTVMTDKTLFALGQADLRPEERGLLDKVAEVVNTVPNQVRIEGHTDNLPIHTARFPSNWELSVMRATTVLRYFESRRVPSGRLEASGHADQRPLVPNDSAANQARNRRVEIVILRRY